MPFSAKRRVAPDPARLNTDARAPLRKIEMIAAIEPKHQPVGHRRLDPGRGSRGEIAVSGRVTSHARRIFANNPEGCAARLSS
jgi:hypothetical protein